MAMPPPHSMLTNFFQPLTLYVDIRDDETGKPNALALAPKRSIFSRLVRRFRSSGRKNAWEVKAREMLKPKSEKIEVHTFTVALDLLDWLENCASKATSRSAMWNKEALLDIQNRSSQYRKKLKYNPSVGAEETRLLLLRASAAAQRILSLPKLPIPPLPHELMRCIFLWVACQDVLEAKKLSLVSRTLQDWVDPCVFKYITYRGEIKSVSSPRIRRAKAHYVIGSTLRIPLDGVGIPRLGQNFPVLRSISTSAKFFGSPTAPIPNLRRLHLEDWNSHLSPLTAEAFTTITHLSLNLRTQAVINFHALDWAPLKHLGGLKYLIIHTHTCPDRGFGPNDSHAPLWIDFLTLKLIPSIPKSVELVLWVVPDIKVEYSLSHYQVLLDGTADPRFLIAFERRDDLNAHKTSESAGAGPYAFIYPPLHQKKDAGLDWLEWLCEEGLVFLKRSKTSEVCTV